MTWDVSFTPTFRRNFQRLPRHIQTGFLENFELFQEEIYHPSLRTHKLHGNMSGLLSSSIDGEYRFVTRVNETKKTILLFNIGNHSIYQP